MDQGGKQSTRDLTNVAAVLNGLKFLIGIGIVSLPEATTHVGWLPSILGLVGVAFVTVWGIFFAIYAREKLEKQYQENKRSESDPLVVSNIARWSDLPDIGLGFFDRIVATVLGGPVRWIFVASILACQFTTLVIYINIVADNIESYFPYQHVRIPVLICVFLVLSVFSMVPTLRGVAVLSALGLSVFAFLFAGLIVEIGHKGHDGMLPKSATVIKQDSHSYGQWFGIASFAFGGLPIAMVMYDEMIHVRSFQTVIAVTYVICWFIYSSFALLGYICYGADANSLIYFNFPPGSVFREGSAAAMAAILCFSYSVQAMPIWSFLQIMSTQYKLGGKSGLQGLYLTLVRIALLLLAMLVAYLVPSIRVMMNYVGGVACTLSGFIIPALVYLQLTSSDEWLERIRCCIVLIVGVVGAIFSCRGY